MPVPLRVLVLFAHPALEASRVHRRLLHHVPRDAGITVHDLYERYPDGDIDVAEEQRLLERHDAIVVQHPFYWYSTPPLVKQWEDLVLEHDWAYGARGTRLAGKLMLNAVTAGGREDAYRATGHNRFTVRQLLAPMEQTALLCRMRYLAPYVIAGTHTMDDAAIERAGADYGRFLARLAAGEVDVARAEAADTSNALAGAPAAVA